MRLKTITLLTGLQSDADNLRNTTLPAAASQATTAAVAIVTGPPPAPDAPQPWTRRQLMEFVQQLQAVVAALSDTLTVLQRSQVQAVADLTSTLTGLGTVEAADNAAQAALIASLQSVATSLKSSLDSNASLDLAQATDLTGLHASLTELLTRLTTLENAAPLVLSTTKAVPLLAVGAVNSWTVAVPGAALNMPVVVSSNDALNQLASVTGAVTAAGVVTLRLRALVAVTAATYPFYVRVLR